MSNYIFKPRAQLLLQLGEQLIKNESVALVELIKNSYDADASYVDVIMNDINFPLIGEIRIKDDGFGMTRQIVENIWLEPGNTHKKDMVSNNNRTPKGRLPIGEKGIGRFGVHKLGRNITLITKSKDCLEVVVELDWDKFNDAKYLKDVEINVFERDPEVFVGESTGTLIIIKNLQNEWKLDSYKDVRRAINNLNSPFRHQNGFHVNLSCNLPSWDEMILCFDDIKKYALYNFNATVDTIGNASYTYKFTPFDGMKNVSGRVRSDSLKLKNEKHEPIIKLDEQSKPILSIGNISFEMYVFDRDSEIMRSYIIDDKKSFKAYLDDNGGIYVFRDGLRVYDYGEKENDWLQLDSRRVNSPAEKLSNNIVIGAVYLKRSESLDLIEKANREGFIENEAYITLKNIINRLIEEFLSYRNSDKNDIRVIKKVDEPVLSNLKQLDDAVLKSSATDTEKKEIKKYIDTIDKEYKYIKEITLTTASAGLSYGVVIHEIEKIVKELATGILINFDITLMRDKIMHLSDIIENYSNLLRNRKKTNGNLLSIAKQARYNCEYRFKVHKINCFIDVETFKNDAVKCTQNLVISSIMNLFDNAIWWIDNYRKEDKKLKVCVSNYMAGYKTLLIIDNGSGFSLRPEDAIKPFVSKKPNGMGIGLNIVNEIMISNGGVLVFPDKDEIKDINFDDIEARAIVGLAFKKE